MRVAFSLVAIFLSLAIGQLSNAQPRPQSEVDLPSSDPTVANPLAHLESVLAPYWPLLNERRKLQKLITDVELELLLIDEQQHLKIPPGAEPQDDKQREENDRATSKARQSKQHIDAFQNELDSVDESIALVKKKAEIEGEVTSINDNRIVEISVGHADGVRRGMRFHVLADEKSIAQLEVTEVGAGNSRARILDNDANASIRTGQRAVMLLDDRVLSEIIGYDPGQPIYNDQLKRFKFRLERIEISSDVEFAERFWVSYKGQGNPPILGVWGDPRTNSLVVVASPDADQAIRHTLARMEGMWTGIEFSDDESLEGLQSQLQRRLRSALQQVTRIQLEIIDSESSGENQDGERVKMLRLQLENESKDLEAIERKLAVISDSMKRLETSTGRH